MSETLPVVPREVIEDNGIVPAGMEGAQGVAAWTAPIPTLYRGADVEEDGE